jgi:hypothetical protein
LNPYAPDDLAEICPRHFTGGRRHALSAAQLWRMRLVNHASELIHQIYQREKVEDVAQWRDAVQFGA